MKMKTLVCQECSQQFYARSSKAKFCGNPCKQKAYRRNRSNRAWSKQNTLTFDEQSFIQAIEAENKSIGGYLWEIWHHGDIATLKLLYRMSQDLVLMDLITKTGILEEIYQVLNNELALQEGN